MRHMTEGPLVWQPLIVHCTPMSYHATHDREAFSLTATYSSLHPCRIVCHMTERPSVWQPLTVHCTLMWYHVPHSKETSSLTDTEFYFTAHHVVLCATEQRGLQSDTPVTHICSLLPPPWRRLCFHRCPLVCLSVCLLATLRKNGWSDFHEIFRVGVTWYKE